MLSCTLRYRERQALTGESSDVLNMEQKPEAAFMQVALQPLKNQPSIGRKKENPWLHERSVKMREHASIPSIRFNCYLPPKVVFTILQAPRTYAGLDCPLVSRTRHWG